MSESQQKVYRRKRSSYRLDQERPYRLREEIKRQILDDKDLFRFVEDYFHIKQDSVYRYLKHNDPALTQIGFLQDLATRLDMAALSGFEGLIEKSPNHAI